MRRTAVPPREVQPLYRIPGAPSTDRPWRPGSETLTTDTDQRSPQREYSAAPSLDGAHMLRLAPEHLSRALLDAVAVLVVAGVVSNLMISGVLYEFSHTFMYEFNLDRENNVPTWFSSLLLFTNAMLLALIANGALQVRDRWRLHWCGLAFIFLMFSLDEAVSFHERSMVPIRESFDLSGPFYFAWVLPAIVLLTVFVALYLRFALALPHRTLRLFVIAALIYIGGALGIEMLGGNYVSHFEEDPFVYGFITIVEESLEMLGQVVFFYGLADYIRSKFGAIRIS